MRFRVREPLLAVRNDPGTPTAFLTIGSGSVITVKARVQQSEFVDVSYEGQLVKVSMRDIEKSADRVEGQTV